MRLRPYVHPFVVVLVLSVALLGFMAYAARAAVLPAPAPNPNCQLMVPADPLSAAGLATPYQLSAQKAKDGQCHELEPTQSAFVEAAVWDPAKNTFGIYHPVVVDAGTKPATDPVVPTLPAGAVVGIWFGSNGDTLKLAGPGAAGAVNGLGGDLFGQFAYINAPAFFQAANTAIKAGKLTVPPLGVSPVDKKPCPSVRDFSVVDQDQSDNVGTPYWNVGGLVQNVPLFPASPASGRFVNGSDEGLLSKFVDPALGCAPWKMPSLDGNDVTVSLAANELSAAAGQQAPVALVPLNDPMVLHNGHNSVAKTNLYRAGVDQPPVSDGAAAAPGLYCKNLMTVEPQRAALDYPLFSAQVPPAPGPGGSVLTTFLTDRYAAALSILGCPKAKAGNGTKGDNHGHNKVEQRHHRR